MKLSFVSEASIDSIGIIAENPLRMVVWHAFSCSSWKCAARGAFRKGFMPSSFDRVFGCLVLVAPCADGFCAGNCEDASRRGCRCALLPPRGRRPNIGDRSRELSQRTFDAAIAAYNSVIAGGDKAAAPYAYAGLSRVYMKQHRVSEAFDAAQKANTLTPERRAAVVRAGRSLLPAREI